MGGVGGYDADNRKATHLPPSRHDHREPDCRRRPSGDNTQHVIKLWEPGELCMVPTSHAYTPPPHPHPPSPSSPFGDRGNWGILSSAHPVWMDGGSSGSAAQERKYWEGPRPQTAAPEGDSGTEGRTVSLPCEQLGAA